MTNHDGFTSSKTMILLFGMWMPMKMLMMTTKTKTKTLPFLPSLRWMEDVIVVVVVATTGTVATSFCVMIDDTTRTQ